ncbi:SDR family oxidoreductase [Pelagibacterales bacterium SAG-MED48]|nr:SDR family oxidoreductase [Pelagibacterales bacterium SAG-MED48]
MKSKRKKIVLITGASRGIGQEILKKLESEKIYQIVFTYNKQKVNITKKDTIGFKCNLERKKDIDNLLKKVQNKFNKLPDIFIGNAGISQIKDFKKINLRDIKKIFEINFFSNFYFTQKLITNMMQNKFGRIIFISSIGGQWGGVNQVHYAASKAALINLSRSLSKLYSKFGVLSNSIAVGLVKTKMSKKEILKNKKIKLNIPMQRFGEKEEIADAVSFLCSKKSSYITGQTINLNGGMLS